MEIKKYITEELMKKSVDLTIEKSIFELAWKYEDIIKVLKLLEENEVTVLGVKILDSKLGHTDNSLYCSEKNYFESIKCIKEYIKDFYGENGNDYYYVIVTSTTQMKVKKYLNEELVMKGVKLTQEKGVFELAWKYKDIIKVLELLVKNKVLILGGEVLNDELNYTYDNWYYNEGNYFKSIKNSRAYINDYYNKNGDDFYYVLIISTERMKILNYINEELFESSIDLTVEKGVFELAWKYDNVIKILDELEKNKILVSGGDVLNNELDYTYDNWSTNEKSYLESIKISKKYVDNYYNKNGNDFYYIIII